MDVHMQATPLFDKVVFSKIKARLGGRVKIIVSGGAPLAGHVEEFLKITMCAPVVQARSLLCHPQKNLNINLNFDISTFKFQFPPR